MDESEGLSRLRAKSFDGEAEGEILREWERGVEEVRRWMSNESAMRLSPASTD